ncbi:2-dehydropantoate 2-reductase [uncultured Ferrimonas sp.]|uniref:ketopantoate reductase family protein n=1 Tax=uncultured Ferrimonas sp. TaxID=432640 RepID=UPI0026129EA1|nr:2-dehydropantoate 2-reductase [uncultured Ferrimonas sp.]
MAETVALIGAGAMAQLYAGLLQQQGITPVLLRRPSAATPTSSHCQSHQLQWLDGHHSQHDVVHQPSNFPCQPTAVLLLTKAQHAIAAATPVLQWLPQHIPLILLHNGMGPQHALAARYPQHNIWAGSVTDGAVRLGQAQVAQRGVGVRAAGALTGQTQLPECLRRLGFQQADNIDLLLWHKLSVNAVINLLCARDRISNGVLLTPPYQAEINALCTELAQLGQALGFRETAPQCQQRILTVAKATASNRCSTLQDVEAARPTELANISGYVLQQAQQHGLSLPHHQRSYQHHQAAVEPPLSQSH